MFDTQQLSSFALIEKYPGAEFSVHEEYNTLVWLTNKYPKPTKEEFEKLVEDKKTSEPMRLLRAERNRRLTETDWMTCSDSPKISNAWKTYRQSLRDLPTSASPKIDEDNQLSNVTWPTKPE